MFISIDGPDGVGKSTVARELVLRLQQNGRNAVLTSEPTKTPLGLLIRKKLKTDSENLTDLFIKDREIHVKAFIEPYLLDDMIVVTDRYKYSTVCYQHLQGMPLKELIDRNKDFRLPDISFILYIDDVTKLLSRIVARSQSIDFFETEDMLQKCCLLYKEMPQHFPTENIQLINADLSEGELLNVLYNKVLQVSDKD